MTKTSTVAKIAIRANSKIIFFPSILYNALKSLFTKHLLSNIQVEDCVILFVKFLLNHKYNTFDDSSCSIHGVNAVSIECVIESKNIPFLVKPFGNLATIPPNHFHC